MFYKDLITSKTTKICIVTFMSNNAVYKTVEVKKGETVSSPSSPPPVLGIVLVIGRIPITIGLPFPIL